MIKRWSDIPEDFYRIDSVQDNNSRIGFLRSLDIDMNNIPESMWINFILLDERGMDIDKIKYRQVKVPVKNIIGTVHPDYGDNPLVKAFKRLKRGAGYCEKLRNHTSLVYHRQLHKKIEEQWTARQPISFIKTSQGYFVKSNGNHRIIIYKMMYLAEIEKARTYEERRKIDNKYYVKAVVYNSK